MNTTLAPILNALGYRGEAAQRGVIKLLQASGALGDVGISGVLSDKQAQAVLDAVTFPTAERAAHWLHDQSQAHMLRHPGTERYECHDTELFLRNGSELRTAFNSLGMLNEVKPKHKQYDHVLVLGAMEGGVQNRLNTLTRLWDEGVRFKQVHLLGSERKLVPEQEFISTITNEKGETLTTEMQMMQARYLDKSSMWPEELRKLPTFAVNTPNKANGERAGTREILQSWVTANPAPGSVLVISSQPHVQHQDAVAKAVLPPSFSVDTVGAEGTNTKISVAVDSLARRIDAGFPKLLERLKHRQSPPPPKLVMLDPKKIKVDAPTYQYRFGGDANGVTQIGRYIAERWDAILHGDPLLVHERLDGRLFVADGHHRLNLAKRLNEKGTGPGMIAAQVLREADGYTAQDVKIIAAYKNLAHGQADPLEAAHVFKEAQAIDHPEWLPSLQMDKGNLRISYSLSRLPDAALDYVARGEVPADKGAMVAEQVSDPAQQETVMRMVSEKLKLRYNAATHRYQGHFRTGTYPPSIAISPMRVESVSIVGASSEMEGKWVEMLSRQQSQATTSVSLH